MPAYGRVAVYAWRHGARAPLAGATVRVSAPPGRSPGTLYADRALTVPVAFPATTGPSGVLELWAPEEARLEAVCAAPGYAPHRVPLVLAAPGREAEPPAGRRLPGPAQAPPGAPLAPTRVAAPLAPAARAAGYARSFGQTTVFGARPGRAGRGGGSVPLAGVAVWAYAPGTDTPWPDPLYGAAGALTPLALPAATDASGQLALWADAPARVELRYQAPGYVAERTLLDLEPPPASVEGPVGETGPRGSLWYSASGAPNGLVGAIDKDHYLDVVTGDVWVLEDRAGSPYGDGPYGSGPYGGSQP